MKDFINRDTERKKINEAIQKINIGTNVIIWIEGDSGVGKSYLLKHSLQYIKTPIFKYLNCKDVYKCEKQDLSQEFSFISNILTTLQAKDPSIYHNCLYNYFDDINRINFYEILETILPSIKPLQWSKDLFAKFNTQSETSQKYIVDKTQKTSLILCLSEIILSLLEIHYKNTNILFCIDDIIWMDRVSLETIETLLSKLRLENKYSFSISFFVTSRNHHELESANERSNYNKFESNIFNEFYTFNYDILLSNFNIKTIREYLLEKERYELLSYIQALYAVTSGNPQELSQTLKFESNEIIRRINNTSENNTQQPNEHYFTSELIYTLQCKNEYTIYILSLISLIEKNITPYMLLSLCKLCIENLNKSMFCFPKYEDALYLLTHKDILVNDNNSIYIKHDSVKSLILDYIIESGDYQEIGNIIAHFILYDKTVRDENYKSRVNLALNILRQINPLEGLSIIINQLDNISVYETENVRIAARCFCTCFHQVDIHTINHFIIPKILVTLVSTSQYDLAYKICKILFGELNQLTYDNKVSFLMNYAKVSIDLGYIKSSNENAGAINILDILIKTTNNDNDLLLAYLLKMSAHEHILEFEEIKNAYLMACEILNRSNQLDNKTLSTFYRNKGLVEFHTNLKNEYLTAYSFAKKICNNNDKNIMIGTCQNNLGLSYFYNGEIDQALNCFKKSYDYLLKAGYDLLRVLNNISMCYFITGDYAMAYEYILKAKCIPLKGIFESKSIEVNLSLIMYKNGQKSEAEQRLDSIVNEYNSGNIVTDTAAYSSAMVNRAYIHLKSEHYLEAYRLYKQSKCHTYKNKNELEQWKRDCLCNLCLYKENIIDNVQFHDLDIHEEDNLIYKRPYSIILFAFYVI